MNKKIIGASVSLLALFALSSCEDTKSSAEQASETEITETGSQMKVLTDAQPAIRVNYSQVRQTLLLAEYLAASSSASQAFEFIPGVPNPVFECESVGFPVPGTFNLTNPLIEDPNSRQESGIVVSQAEGMLGVYTGDTQGTYVVCLTPEGKPYVHWAEGIVQGGYPLGTTWNRELGHIELPKNAEVPETPVPLVPQP